MNQYDLAILRILLKSAAPVSKSKVVDGFPDDSQDFVLSSISDLKQANFIASPDEDSAGETLELVRERKKDVLALISPSGAFQDDAVKQPGRSKGSSGKNTMWIATTLMILGSLASVYVAYAVGVNDRVMASSQQPQLISYQDVIFDVAQMQDGNTAGVMVRPSWHLQPLERYPADVIQVQPGDASIKYYYLAPAKVMQFAGQPAEGSEAGTYTFRVMN